MAQKKQDLTMDSTKNFGDEQTRNEKMEMEALERQKLLACQAIEELQELWEESQRDKNEIKYLKKKIEQLQEDIGTLAAEKQEQCTIIKQLKSQLESVMAQNKENVNETTGEKHPLQKTHIDAHQERETEDRLVGGCQDMMERLQCLMNKNQKLIVETKQASEQMQKNMENIKKEIHRNKKYVTQHRDEIERIKQSMHENVNKLKQRWTEIQRDVHMQEAVFPEVLSRRGQGEGKANFENLKIKLRTLLEETDKLWHVLGERDGQLEVTQRDKRELKTESVQTVERDSVKQKQAIESKPSRVQPERDEIKRAKDQIQTEKEDIERDRQVAAAEMDAMNCMKEEIEKEKMKLADQFEKTKKKIREMEVLSTEIEVKKRELTRTIRMSRRKKAERCEICEAEHAKQEMEAREKSEAQGSLQELLEVNVAQPEIQRHQDNMETSADSKDINGMRRVALEMEELRKTLRRVRESSEQSRNVHATEEKGEPAQEDGSSKQERTLEEQKHLETERLNLREKKEIEENVQKAKLVIMQTGEMKANIQRAAAEMNNTKEEMLKAQRRIEEEKAELRKHMVSKPFFRFISLIISWNVPHLGPKMVEKRLQHPHNPECSISSDRKWMDVLYIILY